MTEKSVIGSFTVCSLMAVAYHPFDLASPSKIKGHNQMQDFGAQPRTFQLVWSE